RITMRRFPIAIAAVTTVALALTACSTPSGGGSDAPEGESISVVAPLSGQLGDKSFMDSAAEGLNRAADELGVSVKIGEAGADEAPAWERNRTEAAASGENELIGAGGTVVASTLEKVAAEFPDQAFLIFDSPSVGDNVDGISYAQNEGA